jgi:hypothetical protein
MNAGVDWITVTSRNYDHRKHLRDRMARLLDGQKDEGNKVEPWAWKGYAGWRAGPVTVGEREDSLFAQVTGGEAGLMWLSLLERPVNVTRLDVQVTVQGVGDERDLAAEGFTALEDAAVDGDRNRSYSRITTKPDGATLYLGATTSAVRCRLYDKHAETKGAYPVGAWRYEVQARSGLAGSLASGLADRDGDALTCVASVYEHFRARGIQPVFCTSGGGVLGHVPRTRSDAERRLRWLREQVRPAVQWLNANGYGAAAREAIRLGDHARS